MHPKAYLYPDDLMVAALRYRGATAFLACLLHLAAAALNCALAWLYWQPDYAAYCAYCLGAVATAAIFAIIDGNRCLTIKRQLRDLES
jgi:hypothetical protein